MEELDNNKVPLFRNYLKGLGINADSFSDSDLFNRYRDEYSLWTPGKESDTATATVTATAPILATNANSSSQVTQTQVNPMQQRLLGNYQAPKKSYLGFNDMLFGNNGLGADGTIDRSDRKALRQEYGLSRRQSKNIANDLNGTGNGRALNNFTKGLSKRFYIDNGKVISEGTLDFNEDAFGKSSYTGNTLQEAINKYNLAITDWRKNATITYDPITGKYTTTGFGGTGIADVTNSSWANTDKVRDAWFKLNKGKIKFNSADGSYTFNNQAIKDTSWMDENFLRGLRSQRFIEDVDKYDKSNFSDWSTTDAIAQKLGISEEDKKSDNYSSIYHDKLNAELKNYTLDNNIVAGTALYNYLKDKGLLKVGNGTNVELDPNHPWLRALLARFIATDPYNLKRGGLLNTIKIRAAYRKGGPIKYAGWGDVLDFVPIVGTVKQGMDMYNRSKNGEELGWQDYASLGLSAASDALMFIPGLGTAAGSALKTGAKGAGKMVAKGVAKATPKIVKTTGKTIGKTGKYLFNPNNIKATKALYIKELRKLASVKNGKYVAKSPKDIKKVEALNKSLVDIEKKLASKAAKTAEKAADKFKYDPWRTAKTRLKFATVGAASRGAYDVAHNRGFFSNLQVPENVPEETVVESYSNPNEEASNQYVQYGPVAYTENPTNTSEYQITGNEYFHKNGGILNMNNIKYFQDGGAVAPQQPALQGADIEQQVVQLVQAAMSGDQKAAQTIEQIMLAAQQGDLQAAQIAQVIQQVAQQMQGQAPAAKKGAKLSYIHSLNTGCPEGYEAKYYKKGGAFCKECVKKVAENLSSLVEMDKCGGKTKKKCEKGTEIKKASCGTSAKKCEIGGNFEYFKCGGKKKKCEDGEKLNPQLQQLKADSIAETLKKKYPQYSDDLRAGRKPIIKNGKKYYMNGDGAFIEESKLKSGKSKKMANGGILTIENLKSAFFSLNK